ncbi:MAG: hypothetical protein PHY12_12790, partial [Eubacteriales bacterium]|nr:hypothetical protein [Eubacteriales bacterium]
MTFHKKSHSSKIWRILLWMLLDIVLCNLSMIVAQQLRFDVVVPEEFFQRYVNIAPVMTAACLLSFWAFGLYRNMWQYASARSILQIAGAAFVAT